MTTHEMVEIDSAELARLRWQVIDLQNRLKSKEILTSELQKMVAEGEIPDHCPIHPKMEIRRTKEKYGPHKGEGKGWCPECDTYFPIGLTYKGFLARYIHLKRSHDEIGSILQQQDAWIEIVRSHLLRYENSAYDQVGELLKQATEHGLQWGMKGTGNIMDLIYFKAKQAVIDDLRGKLARYFEDSDGKYLLPEGSEEESEMQAPPPFTEETVSC